jgi:hypothetical protein
MQVCGGILHDVISPMHRSLIKTTHVAGALVESQILATDGWKLKNIHPRGRV